MPDGFRLVEYCLAFAVVGIASGFFSGLFGIGGGILRIPVFVLLFPGFGIHGGSEMHVAACTSLALAVPTGMVALRKHHLLGNFDFSYFKGWVIGLLFGTMAGIATSSFVSPFALKVAFVVFLVLSAAYFGFVPERAVLTRHPPRGWAKFLTSGGVGAYCVMIGIAGGSLATPVLKACSMPVVRAIAIGSGTSMIVSSLGTAGGIFNGWHVDGRPDWSLGYLDLLVFAVMLPGVWFGTAPGVAVASKMPPARLKLAYAVFLAIIVATMLGHMASA
jgi:uncharacterized protein